MSEECKHYWQHCKFIENTKIRFSMAFYCKHCRKLVTEEYPPLKEQEMKKDTSTRKKKVF